MLIRKNWLSIGAYAGMFVFGIVVALLGAILPMLSEKLSFDLAGAGNLFFVMNLAMLLSMMALGPLMDRFGKRAPLVAGPFLVALALVLIAAASSYSLLLVAVAVLGIGGSALNGATNTLVADLHADPREKNSALNVLGIFFGFGALFLPFTIGSLLQTLGLKRILHVAMALSLAPALLFLALAFPPPRHKEGLPIAEMARLAKNPLVLAFAFLLFFESGNEFIIGGYTSSYLARQLNSTVSAASYLLAAYWGAVMLARVLLSRLLLRVQGPTVVLASAAGAAAGVLLLLAARSQGAALAALVLIGLSLAGIYPTVLGLAGTRFEEYSGTVFGILFTVALTGGMTLPWLVGRLAEAHGLGQAMALAAVNFGMVAIMQLAVVRFTRPTH
jgi:FHS family glucose/mannose:H+ symporter-like MFS transporter